MSQACMTYSNDIVVLFKAIQTCLPWRFVKVPSDSLVRTVVTVAVNTDKIVIPTIIHMRPKIRAWKDRGVVSPYLKK